MVAGGRPWRRGVVIVFGTLLGMLGLVLVLVSPLALSALDSVGGDWRRLSEIGQTYGAVSALISVIALGGVVVSVTQQLRSAQLDREHAYRSVHVELTRMMIDHPDLLDVVAYAPWVTTPTQQRQALYCNQRMLALEMGYEIGALSDEYIYGSAQDLFGSPIMRLWWKHVRYFKRGVATTQRRRRLFDVLDNEWQYASRHDESRGLDDVAKQREADHSNHCRSGLIGWLAAGLLLVLLVTRRNPLRRIHMAGLTRLSRPDTGAACTSNATAGGTGDP